MTQSFTFIDLFSGIGGFRKGLEANGGKCLAYSEIDPYAIKAYNLLYDTMGEVPLGDITKISKQDLEPFIGKVDVLCGGFPCQAFSIAGYRKGILDHRGVLFWEIMRVAKIIKPKVLLLENVKGLLYNKTTISEEEFIYLFANSLNNIEFENSLDLTKTRNKDLVENLCSFLGKYDIDDINKLDVHRRINAHNILVTEKREEFSYRDLVSAHTMNIDGFMPIVQELCEQDGRKIVSKEQYLDYCVGRIFTVLCKHEKQLKHIFKNIRKDGGYNVSTFGLIVSTLAKHGYNIEYGVVNSRDFGVPQNRQRIYIVGYSGKECSGKIFDFS